MAVYSVDTHAVTPIPTEDEECGECQKCGLLQCKQECKPNMSAHFIIKTTGEDQLILANMYQRGHPMKSSVCPVLDYD